MTRQIETTLAEAAARNLSVSATIEWLADMELEARGNRAVERRFKCSRLQFQPTIDGFHFHHHKSRMQAKTRILRLLDLTFLKQGTNLVLIGNPGVGKTFWHAFSDGKRARVISVSCSQPRWTCSITYLLLKWITP
jgi:DNA replication protein DnaC